MKVCERAAGFLLLFLGELNVFPPFGRMFRMVLSDFCFSLSAKEDVQLGGRQGVDFRFGGLVGPKLTEDLLQRWRLLIAFSNEY